MPPEIHPVSGALINPQFQYAAAHAFAVAEIAGTDPSDTRRDAMNRLGVTQVA